MQYVVLGAGAVGSSIGGLLAHMAGADVLLVARGRHAEVMRDRGLTVRCQDVAFTTPVTVATEPAQVHLAVDDVLVLTTKTHQAQTALDEWADVPVHDRSGTVVGRAADVLPVFVATNGVVAERMALRYFARVFAVCVWFPTVMIDPGEVIVRGAPLRGVFHVGRHPTVGPGDQADAILLADLAEQWRDAGLVVERPAAVMDWKYRKLLTNLGNAVQALVGDTPDIVDVREAVEAEGRDVLVAADVAVVSEHDAQAGWQPPGLTFGPVPGEPDRLGGSTWQSLVRGTGSIETDYLNGEIVLLARQLGRNAPLNARLTALARAAARHGRRPGDLTADELRAAVSGTDAARLPTHHPGEGR